MADTGKNKTALADMEELRRLNYRPDKKSPVCGMDCFACVDGRCSILTDNDFGDCGCSFRKTWEQAKSEQRAGLERLVEIGRYELIEKYESVLAALGIFALLDDDAQAMSDELDQFEQNDLRELLTEMEQEVEWVD